MTGSFAALAWTPLAPALRKAFAIAAFLLAALLLYYIDHVPSSTGLDDDSSWSASRGNELVLFGLPPRQIIEFNGASGSGLDVRARVARPTSETLVALRSAGVPTPTTKAASLRWLGKTDAHGKVNLAITNLRGSRNAGISLAATGAANIPQLRLRAVDTSLTVTLSAIAGDSESVPPINVKIGDAALPQPLATMMPVSFELPPGESMMLTFPSAAAMTGSYFRLGTPAASDELASSLAINRFDIAPRREDRNYAQKMSQGVCAAGRGDVLFTRLSPANKDCGQGGDLAVQELSIKPEKVSINVSGSGFVVKDGTATAAGLLTNLGNNKIVAALLGIAYAALARWVWVTLFSKGKE